jgi:hypothetical protein
MSPEEITSSFAVAAASFQPIVGQPTDDDLTALREVLYPLLLEIPYDEPGSHNLIGLIEPTTSYAATWGAAFPVPARPPTYPVIANDATPVVRARAEAEHAVLVRDYALFEAAERATAKFIRDAVDELWYRDLRHQRSFYTNVTAQQLIEHLDANCGGLHPSELVNLPTKMMTYYDKADGIPEYIDLLEEGQRKLARANLPMSDDQLLAIASTAVLASGHFPRPTDEWEALPRANKTWAAWKTCYRAAHIARKRQLLASGHSLQGTANSATQGDTIPPDAFSRLDGYLDNLASAATTKRTTLNQLVETNALLTTTIATLTASVTALTAAYTLIANKAAPAALQPTSGTPASRPRVGLDPNGYCWTHGYKVSLGHTSATCTNPKEGHQLAASRANTMGGSARNKPT